MNVFSAKRLKVARERRGMTRKALAEAIGVTAPSITGYEDSTRSPAKPTVHRLVFALNFPEKFFYDDDRDDLPLEAVSFRSRRSMTAQLRDRTLASGKIATTNISPEFQRRFKLPAVDIPDLSEEDPETAARLLRSQWKLGVGPVANMVHLLESKGVEVYWLEADSPCVDAVSFWRDGKPFVIMNQTKKAGERGRFDAAHELGHLVLHRKQLVVDGHKIETDADRFASAFLLPADQFRAECPKFLILSQFFPAKKRWGTSVQAMIRRGKDLGIYSDWHYERAFKELSAQGWRTQEPDELPREESMLHTMIFDRLSSKGVSPSQFADSTHLNLKEDLAELTPVINNYRDVEPPEEKRESLVQFGHLQLWRSDDAPSTDPPPRLLVKTSARR